MYTEGKHILYLMAVKRSCVLCTYKEEPARLFPSENSEASPNTTMPSGVDTFLKSAKMFLKSLFYKECK
jgi:hypothetical protein